AAAGYGYDVPEMMEAGLRAFSLKRCINYRFGFRAADDDLSPRIKEPARDGDAAGIEIQFDRMKKLFYEQMGFDSEKGVSSREKLTALGLTREAEMIWPQT
ncbi:MAG TPA: aldehyde ferredoxin oxidoreductase C-terminal domain-containing protein, partial [Smithellaceae bacterium]|nr:aldehyde ferredoxin oxidoreductase C-terminal domain-containing protein [Smithellaceae bacterium]